MEKILVVGSGLMGSGITVSLAKAGFDVVVVEKSESDLQRGMEMMKKTVSSLVKRGEMER
ncbi:3-hydroxyacyl-CoA dehydrogenase NAD-binding domain-containing protein [Geobacillus zalihae]|uniref:3-hydroxyacyl-CoA dehydrogenase NAD-binding domain-containing protein n=1 Tax=Geobacillus zalihae TaxID=213419 RepID=UPI0021E06101|nr:3-hydroxyacyl-CoA dehydrogenase NAD-binding domain-containing protein [Geobacillus zalihae]